MHVIEEFTPAVFVDDGTVSFEGVDEMPVPVVEVDAEVLAEVGETVFVLQVGGGVVEGDFDWGLKCELW